MCELLATAAPDLAYHELIILIAPLESAVAAVPGPKQSSEGPGVPRMVAVATARWQQ